MINKMEVCIIEHVGLDLYKKDASEFKIVFGVAGYIIRHIKELYRIEHNQEVESTTSFLLGGKIC